MNSTQNNLLNALEITKAFNEGSSEWAFSLGGSVIINGASENDIDIIALPTVKDYSYAHLEKETRWAMKSLGFRISFRKGAKGLMNKNWYYQSKWVDENLRIHLTIPHVLPFRNIPAKRA